MGRLRPSIEEISSCIEVSADEIKKQALFEHLGHKVSIDSSTETLARQIHESIGHDEHWVKTYKRKIDEFKQVKKAEILNTLRNGNLEC